MNEYNNNLSQRSTFLFVKKSIKGKKKRRAILFQNSQN